MSATAKPPTRRERVLQVLEAAAGPVHTTEIAAQTGLDQRHVNAILRDLDFEGIAEGGRLISRSIGRRWRLKTAAQPTNLRSAVTGDLAP